MKDLNNVFDQITPDCYESIQSQLQNRKEIIIVEPIKKKKYWMYALPVLAVGFLVTLAIILNQPAQVVATVGIDVNPSIAIDIDKQDRIVKVDANNEDGKKIIGHMKLEGSDIEVGTNALIGAMLKEGYIDELKNSLLISVTGDNQTKNEQLRQTLSLYIDDYLKTSQIDGSILSQTINNNTDIQKLADQYGISVGKAELIQELVTSNQRYTFESLKDLSVNDLNILLHNNSVDIHTTGNVASEGSYIGKEKAKQIALTDAGITNPHNQKIELDYDDGVMVYEIEFYKDGIEYEYDVQATDGKILKRNKEGQKQESSSSSSQTNITQVKAKTIAMNHAGVKSVSHYTLKQDYDDGQMEYEIQFVSGEYKYEYTIRAHDGKILESEKENVGQVKINANEAKQKAFAHAKVQGSQATDVDVELKKNYYEVSFQVGQYEYEYHIDSLTGSILHHEKERD